MNSIPILPENYCRVTVCNLFLKNLPSLPACLLDFVSTNQLPYLFELSNPNHNYLSYPTQSIQTSLPELTILSTYLPRIHPNYPTQTYPPRIHQPHPHPFSVLIAPKFTSISYPINNFPRIAATSGVLFQSDPILTLSYSCP